MNFLLMSGKKGEILRQKKKMVNTVEFYRKSEENEK